MELPKRKPTRLADYDYGTPGAYFVTLCIQNRKNILGNIVGEGFPLPQLSPQGKIVDVWINEIPKRYEGIQVDKYVIMPNHIHLLLSVKERNGRGDPSPTIDNIVGWFKYQATKEINRHNHTMGTKVFQRSFYDHIIRGEQDYKEIWAYIDNNPAQWRQDRFYME